MIHNVSLFFQGETSPCLPNPCSGGGTCEEHDNTFTCFCPDDRTGDRCERALSENDLRVRILEYLSGVFLQLQRMDRQLLCQKVRQIISVIKTNTCVFVVFETKRELKCQNELFLKYHFSGNTSLYVFITEII